MAATSKEGLHCTIHYVEGLTLPSDCILGTYTMLPTLGGFAYDDAGALPTCKVFIPSRVTLAASTSSKASNSYRLQGPACYVTFAAHEMKCLRECMRVIIGKLPAEML